MAEKKKVYAVTRGSYSDYRVVRIFSDLPTAEKFVEACKDDGWEEMGIETYDLDDETTLDLNELVWEVSRSVASEEDVRRWVMQKKGAMKPGDIIWEAEVQVEYWGRSPEEYRAMARRKEFYLGDSGDVFGIFLFAPSKEAALKIANECYSQVLVRNDMIPFEDGKTYSFPSFNLIEKENEESVNRIS
jgi:hypothetical protein